MEYAEYDEAKRDQATIEGRIYDLEQALNNAELIPGHDTPSETVVVGSLAVLRNATGVTVEYTIVGSMEADPAHVPAFSKPLCTCLSRLSGIRAMQGVIFGPLRDFWLRPLSVFQSTCDDARKKLPDA